MFALLKPDAKNAISKNTPSAKELKFQDVNTDQILDIEAIDMASNNPDTVSNFEETVSTNSNMFEQSDSLANLNFLKFGNASSTNLNYTEPSESLFVNGAAYMYGDATSEPNPKFPHHINHHTSSTDSCRQYGSEKKTLNHHQYHSAMDSRKISNLRNRRIVVMLSLLTLSFTISTVPSSIFYTFFRPIINDKPYKRLFTLIFNLLRHLSHSFNFIIYFTSSSVIKHELKETIKEFKEKRWFSRDCFVGLIASLNRGLMRALCYVPTRLKRMTTRNSASSQVNNAATIMDPKAYETKSLSDSFRQKAKSLDEQNTLSKLRSNSANSMRPSDSASQEELQDTKEVFTKMKDEQRYRKKSSVRDEALMGKRNCNYPILESSL